MEFTFTPKTQQKATSTQQQPPPQRELRETCGCDSGLWPDARCKGCREDFCRHCLLDHSCKCALHPDNPLIFYCHKCTSFGCYLCFTLNHKCVCADKKHVGVQGKLETCQICGSFYCILCEPAHVCLCDCGSGRQAIFCEICERLYCSACHTRRHDCDCEQDNHGPEAVDRICAWGEGTFYCSECFSFHECCCACELVPTEGHAHCRICSKPFCHLCVNGNHSCACGYCGEKAVHRMCQLCNRLFCQSCIGTHPCACESPKCKHASFTPLDQRQFCLDCLRLYCATCYPSHACTATCECKNPVRYQCACKAGLCEKCVQTHECETMKARRILGQFNMTSGLGSFTKPVTSCPLKIRCEFTARIGTWNMNHLSATTTEIKKSLKKNSIGTVCSGTTPLDVLALQEINSTAIDQLNGLPHGAQVLHWGPLLQSQSALSRLEFHKQFKLPVPTTFKSKNEDLNTRKKVFYEALLERGLKAQYASWREAIDTNRATLSGNSEKDKELVYQDLKKTQPIGEKLYEEFAGIKFRYQEYYPLVGVPSKDLTVHPKVDLYFPNSTVKGLAEREPYVFRGKDEDLEFRPVVVYRLKKTCAAEGCTGLMFNLGVVHTSPEQGTSEFNRLYIYQHQLKSVLSRIVSEGGLWVVVGDYYLTAETIVDYPQQKKSTSRRGRKDLDDFIDYGEEDDPTPVVKKRRKSSSQRLPSHSNRDRNSSSLKINFEQQIPDELEIVASVSATNHPTWTPKYDPFSSVRAQVADFGICSRAWPIKRAYPIDSDNGSIVAVDLNSRAFQLMKTDDTSDHSPVLVYVAKDSEKASTEIRSMLGYSESSDKQALEKSSQFQHAKSEAASERVKELQETCDELAKQLKRMVQGNIDYVEIVQKYRAALQTLLRLIAPTSKLDTLDFVPGEPC